jgi:hypothetical protein
VSSATAPQVCTCADGVICDSCASQQIESSVPAGFVELLPGMLNTDEQDDLHLAATSWLSALNGGQYGQ